MSSYNSLILPEFFQNDDCTCECKAEENILVSWSLFSSRAQADSCTWRFHHPKEDSGRELEGPLDLAQVQVSRVWPWLQCQVPTGVRGCCWGWAVLTTMLRVLPLRSFHTGARALWHADLFHLLSKGHSCCKTGIGNCSWFFSSILENSYPILISYFNVVWKINVFRSSYSGIY